MKPQATGREATITERLLLFCVFLLLGFIQISSKSRVARDEGISIVQPDAEPKYSHYIYDGSGRLDQCPNSPIGWLPGSWLQLGGTGSSQTPGLTLPHSSLAQQMIWRHQHPVDCNSNTTKFLIYEDYGVGAKGHGIGSVLHQQANALMVAMDTSRVLVVPPGSFLAADPSFCNSNSRSLDSCYFEPLTHCQLSERQLSEAFRVGSMSKEQQGAFYSGDDRGLPRVVSLAGQIVFKHVSSSRAPHPFTPMLFESDIPAYNHNYWWKAQAIAYIMRPNQNTLRELERRKSAKLRGRPLQPGCVSVYIRHGDKGTESQVFEDGAYEEALKQLRAENPSLSRQVFLSTEDPQTVKYFTNKTRGWDTTYVDMPRKPDRKKSNVEYMLKHGVANEMLDGLLNLDLALQCDGFVSSINGNWARLIEELRATVRCKAGAPYMDVGERSARGLRLQWP